MMSNVNPETGVRYGVIACNSLDQDLVSELFNCGTDLSYQAAYEEARAEAAARWNSILEAAQVAAAEVDYHMGDDERERFIESKLMEMAGSDNEEEFIEEELHRFSDCFQCDEPRIEGECEGIKYGISWLGGAPLLLVYEGPLGFAERLCSPCVPNAADLDGGFEPTSIPLADIHRDHDGYLCYVVPADWLHTED